MSDKQSVESFSIIRVRVIKYLLTTIILLASIFLSLYTHKLNTQKEKEEFRLISQQVTQLINDRMDYYTQLLLGGVGLYAGSDEVTRDDWNRFTKIQHIDSKFLGVQGLGYAEVIKPNELEEHIKSMRAQGFSDYTVKPKGKRELYTSIIYLNPFNERNKRAFGYDMYSQETRNKAMRKAIETVKPSLSGKVRLLQENGVDEQAGFLLYLPVYKRDMPLLTNKERYEAIQGFVYAPFRAKNLFNNIAGNMTQKIGVEIYDGETINEDALLIRTFKEDISQDSTLHLEDVIDVGNRLWKVRYTSLESRFNTLNEASPLIILISGVLLSILLFFFLRSLIKMELKQQRNLEKLKGMSLRKSLALRAGIIGIWEWDYESNTLLWDEHMYAIYGIDKKDGQENPFEQWSNALDEVDKLRTQKKLDAAVENNSEFNAKFWIITPNGERRYIHSVGLNELDSGGKAIRMVGTNIDITEQKLVEVQLSNEQEALLQVETTGFIHLSGRKFSWTNSAFERMLGYKPGELKGQDTRVVYENEESYLEYGKHIYEALAQNGTYTDEIKLIKKDSTPVTLLAALTKLKGTKDEAMGVFMDITHQKQLEENLQEEVVKKTEENFKQFQVLQHQSKLASMGEMIGAIAHQWRQPLNELSIRIQKIKYKFASNDIDEEYIGDFVEKNTKTIEFMSKTIDDFRNFFRIDKAKHEFSLKEAIEEIANIQDAQLANNNIKLDFIADDSILEGYKTEFQQVIINLISNSKDALVSNKIQEPKILITLKNNTIMIKDNAGGIDEKIIERVFEPYFTTKEQGEGTGMGLYMSKMIIEDNMNGEIIAKNVDDGLEVRIKL